MLRSLARPGVVAGAILAALFAAPASAQKEIKIGVHVRPDRAVRRRRLGRVLPRHQVRDRHDQRARRRRGRTRSAPIYVDAQSKADVAINETERLLNQEKVDMIMGVFSSAHCVPMAQKVDAAKTFMWANVCVASAVFKDKKLTIRLPAQVHSDQFGEASCTFLNEQAEGTAGQGPEGPQGRDHL